MFLVRVMVVFLSWSFIWTGSASSEKLYFVFDDFPPSNYIEDGEVRGTAADIVRKLCFQAGMGEPDFRLLPFNRAIYYAQTEPNMVLMTVARTPVREHQFHWVGPLVWSSSSFFRKSNNHKVHPSSLHDLKHYSVGVIDKNHYNEMLEGKVGILVRIASPQQLVRLLMAGRIDLLVSNRKQVDKALLEEGFDDNTAEAVLTLFHQNSTYLAVSLKTSEALLKKLQNAYEQLKEMGEIPTINSNR